MPWPPLVGEPLPRAENATGVREKLATYSLDPRHPNGGAKARGFEVMLGITIDALNYLENEIRAGVLEAPVASVRTNRHQGFNCVVEFRLHGVGQQRARVATVRTIWVLDHVSSYPRLVSAFLKG